MRFCINDIIVLRQPEEYTACSFSSYYLISARLRPGLNCSFQNMKKLERSSSFIFSHENSDEEVIIGYV